MDLQAMEVRVRDGEGRLYDAQVREYDHDSFEAYVPRLEWGQSYILEVSGLAEGASVFEFIAVDD